MTELCGYLTLLISKIISTLQTKNYTKIYTENQTGLYQPQTYEKHSREKCDRSQVCFSNVTVSTAYCF